MVVTGLEISERVKEFITLLVSALHVGHYLINLFKNFEVAFVFGSRIAEGNERSKMFVESSLHETGDMGATESKLAFRKSVFQLYEQQNIPATNEEYWANFYKLPETAEDVFNLFAPKDIRRVREVAVSNLETLFQKIIGRLFTFVSSTAAAPTKDDCRDVLNCIRILTRLLPYAFEMEDGRLEEKLFWSPAEGEEPLGSILAKAVVQLLFFRGYDELDLSRL
ncbi:hypothetical protein HKX48_004461 [Thoreauomyces humboldtii]|nr:hypothetical protein HKX48_004461 [Thoreauomyces humboldtii]